MDSNPIVRTLRREKNLLEQVLCLAICQLDLVQDGRLEDLEASLLVRAERMKELAITEANVNAKMPEIENDPTVSSTELPELDYLNLQTPPPPTTPPHPPQNPHPLPELVDSGVRPGRLTGA